MRYAALTGKTPKLPNKPLDKGLACIDSIQSIMLKKLTKAAEALCKAIVHLAFHPYDWNPRQRR